MKQVESLTEVDMVADNELICEKLLGWKRATSKLVAKPDFIWMDGHVRRKTPRFCTWAEAGLILDWLMARVGPGLPELRDDIALGVRGRTLTPASIRAAVLDYLKAVKR